MSYDEVLAGFTHTDWSLVEPAKGPPSPPPEAFGGRYQPLKLLGAGSFGEVWRAEDLEGGPPVAIKFIRSVYDDPSQPAMQTILASRFEREIVTLANLDHPSIVAILDEGQDDGRSWFASELAHGVPLDGNGLVLHQLLVAFADLASALAHAGARGFVHRDLKPANVLVDARQERLHVSVLDFGVAALKRDLRAHAAVPLTGGYIAPGTPEYMSPEHARGTCGPRSDVYCMGVMLYTCLAGTYPFQGALVEIIHGHTVREPPPLELLPQWASAVDGQLTDFVMSLLRKSYDERPAAHVAAQQLRVLSELVGPPFVPRVRVAKTSTGSSWRLRFLRPPEIPDSAQTAAAVRSGAREAWNRRLVVGVGLEGADRFVTETIARQVTHSLAEAGMGPVLRVEAEGKDVGAAARAAVSDLLRNPGREAEACSARARDVLACSEAQARDIAAWLAEAGDASQAWEDGFVAVLAMLAARGGVVVSFDVAVPAQWVEALAEHSRLGQGPVLFLCQGGSGGAIRPASVPEMTQERCHEMARRLAPGVSRRSAQALAQASRRDVSKMRQLLHHACAAAASFGAVDELEAEVDSQVSARAQQLAQRRFTAWLSSLAGAASIRRALATSALLPGVSQTTLQRLLGSGTCGVQELLSAGWVRSEVSGTVSVVEPLVALLESEGVVFDAVDAALRQSFDSLGVLDLERALAPAYTALALARDGLPERVVDALDAVARIHARSRDNAGLAWVIERLEAHESGRVAAARWRAEVSLLARDLPEAQAGVDVAVLSAVDAGEPRAIAEALELRARVGLRLNVSAARSAAALGLRLLEIPEPADHYGRARHTALVADLRRALAASLPSSRRVEALELLGSAAEAHWAAGDLQGEAHAHLQRVRVIRSGLESGVPVGSVRDLEVSLTRARMLLTGLHDLRGQAMLVWEAGGVAMARGLEEQAMALFGQAGEAFDSAGDFSGRGYALHNRGEASRRLGKMDRAVACQDAAIDVFASLPDPRGVGVCHAYAGLALLDGDRRKEAAERFTRAVSTLSGLDEALPRVGLAAVAALEGQLDAAVAELRRLPQGWEEETDAQAWLGRLRRLGRDARDPRIGELIG